MIDIILLGTSALVPLPDRALTAVALTCAGHSILFDCGEGTQTAARKAGVSLMKADVIALTHYHGDHLFGLFGLLNTMTMYGRTADLYIYGPRALGSVINFYKSFFGEHESYEIKFVPVDCREPQVVHTSKWVQVSAFPLNHKIECYGYRFDEIVTERHWQENPAYHPKSYAYCSDTAPMPQLAEWVRGVDVLYHEATYPHDMADKAADRGHSTTVQAATCARDAEAGRLLVGHYSSRISDFDALVQECRDVFPETTAAQDGDVFEI